MGFNRSNITALRKASNKSNLKIILAILVVGIVIIALLAYFGDEFNQGVSGGLITRGYGDSEDDDYYDESEIEENETTPSGLQSGQLACFAGRGSVWPTSSW